MEKTRKITINGREYPSLDAMPPEDRALYEKLGGLIVDKDGDGIPDIFQAFEAGDATGIDSLRALLESAPEGGLRMETKSTMHSIFDGSDTIAGQLAAAALASSTAQGSGNTASAQVQPQAAQPAPLRAGGTVVRADRAGSTRVLVGLLVAAIAGVAWWMSR